MDRIRILAIPSSDYLGHPFPQRYNHILEMLHESPFEVHVIRFRLYDETRLKTRTVIRLLHSEIRSRSIASYYFLNLPIHNLQILSLSIGYKYDLLFASNISPWIATPLIIKMLRLSRRPTIVFDLQDYFPMSAAGYITNEIAKTMVENLVFVATRLLVRCADIVTAPSRTLLRWAAKVGAKRTYFLPNGVPNYFVPLYHNEAAELRRELGLEKSIILGFVGSLEFWLNFKPIIDALKKLVDEGLDVRLVLIGGKLHTPFEKTIFAYAEEQNVDSYIVRIGFVPHNEVPKYIAMFDFGLIPFDPSNPLNKFVEEPLKLWEYLSQEVIPLASPLKAMMLYHRIFVFFYHSHDDIVRIVRSYISSKEVFRMKARMGRDFVLRERTWPRIVSRFKRFLLQMLVKRWLGSRR